MQEIVDNINHILSTSPTDGKSIIIYDIDNTLIYEDGNPNAPIIATYQYAKNLGFIPVIITARYGTEENIKRTLEQLKEHGITDYRFIFFLHPERNDPARYKLLARKQLYDRGYKAVMSIGDMPWDYGPYGGIGIKLPS
jgi:predicted secreted acid phosphatase